MKNKLGRLIRIEKEEELFERFKKLQRRWYNVQIGTFTDDKLERRFLLTSNEDKEEKNR
jgi:hypothetical protein